MSCCVVVVVGGMGRDKYRVLFFSVLSWVDCRNIHTLRESRVNKELHSVDSQICTLKGTLSSLDTLGMYFTVPLKSLIPF